MLSFVVKEIRGFHLRSWKQILIKIDFNREFKKIKIILQNSFQATKKLLQNSLHLEKSTIFTTSSTRIYFNFSLYSKMKKLIFGHEMTFFTKSRKNKFYWFYQLSQFHYFWRNVGHIRLIESTKFSIIFRLNAPAFWIIPNYIFNIDNRRKGTKKKSTFKRASVR